MRVVDDHIDRLWKLREQATSFADIAAIEAAIAALSHAAGQDGEQCRAASVSGDIETMLDEVVIAAREDERCNDHGNLPSARRRAHESLQDAKAQLLRALSRGVPEGETPKRGEATGDTTTFSDAWARLSPIDRAVITTYFERHFSPAIAAQRKEGE